MPPAENSAPANHREPSLVAAVHTAASDLRWHPHIHAIASRGGWDREGGWHSVASVDTRAAELLFRHKVISLLAARGLLTEDRIELLDSWKSGHTGFSAHNAVTARAGDHGGLERLARYLLRPPLPLERLTLEPRLARYRHKRAQNRRGEPLDPTELLARLVMHIPAPRLHLVRYYGHYAHVSRARRRAAGEAAIEAAQASDPADEVSRARGSGYVGSGRSSSAASMNPTPCFAPAGLRCGSSRSTPRRSRIRSSRLLSHASPATGRSGELGVVAPR